MSVRQKTNEEKFGGSKNSRQPESATRWMHGTRVGTIEDWREGGTRRKGKAQRRGEFRDGR